MKFAEKAKWIAKKLLQTANGLQEDQIKKQRLNQMMQKKAKLKSEFISKNLNSTQLFIAEEFEDGYTVGYTGNYIRVYIKGEFLGPSALVKLVSCFRDGALCEVMK